MVSLTACFCISSRRSQSARRRFPSRCCVTSATRSALRVGLSVVGSSATRFFNSSTVSRFKASASVAISEAIFLVHGIGCLCLFEPIATHFIDHLCAHDDRMTCFQERLGTGSFLRIVPFNKGIEPDIGIDKAVLWLCVRNAHTSLLW